MNITVIAVGHLKQGLVKDLLEEYSKRLGYSVRFIEVESKKKLEGQALKEEEGRLIAKEIKEQTYIIALDENGDSLKSEDFAALMNQKKTEGISNFTFIIGGANGLCSLILKKAHLVLSFGKLTWPHMLVRVMLLEQIYRAQQISIGHPYHRA